MFRLFPEKRLKKGWRIPLRGLLAACALVLGLALARGAESQVNASNGWPEATFPDATMRGAGLTPNESFTFRMQWGFIRRAGTTKITTRLDDSEDGVNALIVETKTNSNGLADALYPIELALKARLDAEQWRLIDSSMKGSEGKRLRDMDSVFDYETNIMTHLDRNYADRSGDKDLPYAFPVDDSSAMLQMRGWDLTPGNQFPLLVNSKGKLYYIEMRVAEKTNINSKFGKRDAYRIEPVNAYPEGKLFREGGNFTFWISDDEERLPLRFDVKINIGTLSMMLEDYSLAKTFSSP